MPGQPAAERFLVRGISLEAGLAKPLSRARKLVWNLIGPGELDPLQRKADRLPRITRCPVGHREHAMRRALLVAIPGVASHAQAPLAGEDGSVGVADNHGAPRLFEPVIKSQQKIRHRLREFMQSMSEQAQAVLGRPSDDDRMWTLGRRRSS